MKEAKSAGPQLPLKKGLQSHQKHLEQRSKGELLLIRKSQIPNKKWSRVEHFPKMTNQMVSEHG